MSASVVSFFFRQATSINMKIALVYNDSVYGYNIIFEERSKNISWCHKKIIKKKSKKIIINRRFQAPYLQDNTMTLHERCSLINLSLVLYNVHTKQKQLGIYVPMQLKIHILRKL